MPKKKSKLDVKVPQTEAAIPPELLDRIVTGPMTQDQVEAVFRKLKKAIVEKALGAELTQHLRYPKGEKPPEDQSNHRNGTMPKRC